MTSPEEYSPLTAGAVQVSQPATADERRQALRLALRSVQPPAHERLVESLLAAEPAADALSGLFEVRAAGSLRGACWLQALPGNTATFWPPEVADGVGEQADIYRALVRAALEAAESSQFSFVQSLVESPEQAQPLLSEGFEMLAELMYLMSPDASFPAARPTSSLQFDAFSEAQAQRFADVLERTYEQTLDCPALNALRSTDDVLAGYRAAGRYEPSRWLIAREGQTDVGCLLLTEHPDDQLWEVVYMGLTPPARGRGLGRTLLSHAAWLAGQGGASALVLAVDANNQPAVSAYRAADMVEWDRRWALWFRPSRGA